MFGPVPTERLLLRNYVPGDAEALRRRRNHPEVARYQDWQTPFEATAAQRMVDECRALGGPTADTWWNAAIVEQRSDRVIGDLAVGMSNGTRTAEVGYTLDRDSWGQGYAVEALDAILDHLWESVGITRAEGKLHPDNVASAMVLERCGFEWEGHTRLSYWLGDECSDDWIYGMTRPDWEAWRSRPREPASSVELVEITACDLDAVMSLRTHKSQERFVTPVGRSLAEASVPQFDGGHPVAAWPRAVRADGAFVGFVMLSRPTPGLPEPGLWRLLVDRRHQRRGIGRLVLGAVYDALAATGATTIVTSWVPGKGSPGPMYLAQGFVPTGDIDHGEIVARRPLP